MQKKYKLIWGLLLAGMFCAFSSCGWSKAAVDNEGSLDLAILSALGSNNLEYLKECIESGADINKKINIAGIEIHPPLAKAVLDSSYYIVEYLVEQGADVNYTDPNGSSLLMLIASENSANTIAYCELFVENGADIHHKNKDGYAALDVATRQGNLGVVKYLLENGACISDDTIRLLIEHNNYRGYPNYNLKKVIFEAAEAQNYNTGVDSIIVSAVLGNSQNVINGAQNGEVNEDNSEEVLCNSAAFCTAEVLDVLIGLGCDINTLDRKDNSLMEVAASNGNIGVLKYLYGNGLPIQGDLLSLAIKGNHYDVVEYLFQQGELLSYYDNPMDDVIYNGNIELADLLFSNGYPQDEEMIYHAADKSIQFHQLSLLKYFLDKGLDVNDYERRNPVHSLLETCGVLNDLEAAEFLIELGVNANGTVSSNPLQTATSFELVKLLIENGADVNKAATYSDGSKSDPPLMMAVRRGQFEIVKLLIENGADIEYQYWDSKTTVIQVAAETSNNILRYLIDKEANINYQNSEGITALMKAALAQNEPNKKMLKEYGANLELKDAEGNTALDLEKNDSIPIFYDIRKSLLSINP